MKKIFFITIQGIVQGVGFRPFINKLAIKHKIKGIVYNKTGSVIIESSSSIKKLKPFIEDIKSNKPPSCIIEKITLKQIKSKKIFKNFSIVKSKKANEMKFIPPDLKICNDCLKELFDQKDKRYLYPFINCTNCGPRFTIIKNTPYDRKNTTMDKFIMCSSCNKEYNDIKSRRYHAEPNACSLCGPELILQKNNGTIIDCDDVISETKNLLKQGKIIAIKGIGGFHIAALATDDNAVLTLKKRKKRTKKPFAVMSDTIEKVKKYAYVSEYEEILLNSIPAPIVLLKKKNNNLLSKYIAEGLSTVGVFLPYSPLHFLLFDEDIPALIMTSANLSEEPIQYKNEEAFLYLKDIVDFFLFHNRDINIPADDSVIKPFNNSFVFIRRSRGYVPLPIKLNVKSKDIIGVGALLRNTICILKDNYAIPSQHIGDLENEKAFEYFKETIENFMKFYEVNPKAIVCDLHPDYLSTRFAIEFAKEKNIKFFQVQHHYAHFLSCLVDNNLHGQAIGVIFDGTGYGIDGNIWGGEFLVGDEKIFKRVAHFKNIKLPGGDLASKETFRCSISLLSEFLSEEEIKKIYPDKNVNLILTLIKKSINTPLSSSVGRIFDAVSSLLNICDLSTYDAEAPMRLEAIAHIYNDKENYEIYPYKFIKINNSFEIDIIPMIKKILEKRQDEPPEFISYSFHMTLAEIICKTVNLIYKDYKIKNVILSGGVFQNTILLKKTTELLKNNGFNVLFHKNVSPNDSGISLGQVFFASKKI